MTCKNGGDAVPASSTHVVRKRAVEKKDLGLGCAVMSLLCLGETLPLLWGLLWRLAMNVWEQEGMSAVPGHGMCHFCPCHTRSCFTPVHLSSEGGTLR